MIVKTDRELAKDVKQAVAHLNGVADIARAAGLYVMLTNRQVASDRRGGTKQEVEVRISKSL